MLHFDSPHFRRALEETAAWYALQSVGAPLVDANIAAQRRIAHYQASQLIDKARVKANRGWLRRELTNTKEWHQASALLKRIHDFLNPLRHSFRSPALKPDFSFDTSHTNQAWGGAVAETVAKRAAVLNASSLGSDAYDVDDGRLLLYIPEENLACGGAEYASHGFFDVNNVPPWDLWVAFSDQTLVTWVPTELIDTAQMGIDANPEACIRWVD